MNQNTEWSYLNRLGVYLLELEGKPIYQWIAGLKEPALFVEMLIGMQIKESKSGIRLEDGELRSMEIEVSGPRGVVHTGTGKSFVIYHDEGANIILPFKIPIIHQSLNRLEDASVINFKKDHRPGKVWSFFDEDYNLIGHHDTSERYVLGFSTSSANPLDVAYPMLPHATKHVHLAYGKHSTIISKIAL